MPVFFCAQSGSRTRTSLGHMTLNHACLPISAPGLRHTKVNKKKNPTFSSGILVFGDLAGARTQDPLLKREMLYQLSYQVGQIRMQIYYHLFIIQVNF